LFGSLQAYKKAVATKVTIFHFHDPEFIPVGILLALKGESG